MSVRRALRLTTGTAVAGLALWAGTGISSAATTSAGSTEAPISSTNCPTVGSFGNGTPSSADQAYSAISPTAVPSSPSSGQLAFTGANLPKEAAGGVFLIVLGGVAVQRTRRRRGDLGGTDLSEAPVQP